MSKRKLSPDEPIRRFNLMLPISVFRDLQLAAAQKDVSMAYLVRQGIDQVLHDAKMTSGGCQDDARMTPR